jgi:AraC family transcriptional activator of mtrCDE
MVIAGRCLMQTELAIETIGKEVGYWSKAAFQRAFKRYSGITPAQWRQAHAGEHPSTRRTVIRRDARASVGTATDTRI